MASARDGLECAQAAHSRHTGPAAPVVVPVVELCVVECHVPDQPHPVGVTEPGPGQVVDRPGQPRHASPGAVEQVRVKDDDVTRSRPSR